MPSELAKSTVLVTVVSPPLVTVKVALAALSPSVVTSSIEKVGALSVSTIVTVAMPPKSEALDALNTVMINVSSLS